MRPASVRRERCRCLDRAGLLAALVDREHEAAIDQLLIHIDRSRGQEQHHRPLHPVLLGDQHAGRRVLAGGGDRQLALRLQHFERIGGLPHPFLLGDGEDLVLQIRARPR